MLLCCLLLLIGSTVQCDPYDVTNGDVRSSVDSQLETPSDNDCEQKKSADEFPADVFSQQQRIHGAFLIHLFVLAYCFLFVAFVCQDYFLPAVFCICSACTRKQVYNVQKSEIYTVCEHVKPVKAYSKTDPPKPKPLKDIIELYEDRNENKFLILWKWFNSPIRFLLSWTVPDCKSRTRIYPLTFVMSMVWIGICSYIACWMTTILGNTFDVPDIAMGMIFLSVCGNIPEMSSAFINARNDMGPMSISNTLGANTLDILLSLGMPWFVKNSLPPKYGGGVVRLSTGDLMFNCVGLASAVLILNIIAAVNRYRMNRIFGFSCLFSYFGIIILFVMVSLGIVGIFSVSNGSAC